MQLLNHLAAMPEHFLANKKIIIAGGGIAGISFAIAINKLYATTPNPPITIILERDSHHVAKQREGYSLSLSGHDDTGGLVALQKMDLLDQAIRNAVPGTENGSFKIWGRDWKEKACLRRPPREGLPVSGIRIARKELRGMLQDTALSLGTTIRWESQCTSASRTGNGVKVEVRRGDGTTYEEHGDLLLVADGASSKLRGRLRPSDRLEYAGAVLRGGLSRFETGLPEPLSRDWGFQLSGDGASCFYSPVDHNSVVWAVGHLEPQEAPPLDLDDPKAATQVIEHGRKLGTRFHEPFNTLVDHTDPSTVMLLNARDKSPFPNAPHLSSIPAIFIGDANHALSPFAGYGANLALSDAWDLAQALCGSEDLDTAVRAYDEKSVTRAEVVVKRSRRMLKLGHSEGWRLWLFLVMLMVGRWVRALLGRR